MESKEKREQGKNFSERKKGLDGFTERESCFMHPRHSTEASSGHI